MFHGTMAASSVVVFYSPLRSELNDSGHVSTVRYINIQYAYHIVYIYTNIGLRHIIIMKDFHAYN